LRGTGGENQSAPGIIMCEEMAFMDDSLWDVIFPLTGRDKASLIGITTMDSENNPVNQLFEMKDDNGKAIFRVISFDFVCDDCKQKGIVEKCDHKDHELPPWLSGGQMKKMRAVYQAGGHSQQYMAEMKGIMMDETIKPLYDKKDIARFEMRPMIEAGQLGTHRNVWIACDPYGGGTNSDYCLISMVQEGRHKIVSIFSFYFVFCWASNLR